MEITLTTPSLLFPAVSLLLLAYTNRFLGLANLIRNLHSSYQSRREKHLLEEIANLRHRLHLIRTMQILGVSSIFTCVVCMMALFAGWIAAGKILFGASLFLMAGSLAFSLWEIQISVHALDLHLHDIEDAEKKNHP